MKLVQPRVFVEVAALLDQKGHVWTLNLTDGLLTFEPDNCFCEFPEFRMESLTARDQMELRNALVALEGHNR